MKRRDLRWYTAGLIAFLMGVPLAEEAQAGDVGDIFSAAFSLAGAIIDAAGNS